MFCKPYTRSNIKPPVSVLYFITGCAATDGHMHRLLYGHRAILAHAILDPEFIQPLQAYIGFITTVLSTLNAIKELWEQK